MKFVSFLLNSRKFKFYKHFAANKSIRELLFGNDDENEEPLFPKSKYKFYKKYAHTKPRMNEYCVWRLDKRETRTHTERFSERLVEL